VVGVSVPGRCAEESWAGSQAAATTAAATSGVTGICGGAVAGTQVIVKGPSGKLLATTNLRKDVSDDRAVVAVRTDRAGRPGRHLRVLDIHPSRQRPVHG
jgi:hypothetical protein